MGATSSQLWFWMAIGAAISWGFAYPLGDKILKAGVNPFFMLAITSLFQLMIAGILAAFKTDIFNQIEIIKTPKIFLFYMACASSYIIGNILIYSSIKDKNAALASLVEISYPVFTVFFAWLLFREFHLNLNVLIGGMLIFSGVILIYLKG